MMVREDGRAIRRYNRSRNWCKARDLPSWRYAAITNGFSRTEQDTTHRAQCDCETGMVINREAQLKRWITRNRAAGSWIAPLGIVDHIPSIILRPIL